MGLTGGGTAVWAYRRIPQRQTRCASMRTDPLLQASQPICRPQKPSFLPSWRLQTPWVSRWVAEGCMHTILEEGKSRQEQLEG